jgi:YegS/Rv2252/BmrU family lipid kinase
MLRSAALSSVSIIINPIAGGANVADARLRAEQAAAVLTARGETGDIFVTERKDHARELAAGALARRARLIVAWGGDGTVNEIASALMGTTTALGIVPSGSGNGLARELGIAKRPDRALADALAATSARTIDAGELGGRLFVSVAGIGFDAHVAACFDRDLTGRRGFGGYARITARELLSYAPCAYRVSGDTDRTPHRAMLITLANSAQFGNGARIAPAAKVDDGLLDLVVFEEQSRLSTICGLPKLFTGGAARLKGVTIERIKRVVVECERPIPFHVDGEPVQGGTRLEGRVLPGALRVVVR